MVGIDSMVLIFAGLVPNKGKKSKEFAELNLRARLLLYQLRAETIVLPTIAVSELLVPVPAAKKSLLLGTLSARFTMPSFNLPAAVIAAELWAHHEKLPRDLRYTDRRVLKADLMIVASAKAAGATKFYTHDKKCRAVAANVMQTFDLPKNDPSDMFIMDDLKKGEV